MAQIFRVTYDKKVMLGAFWGNTILSMIYVGVFLKSQNNSLMREINLLILYLKILCTFKIQNLCKNNMVLLLQYSEDGRM